MEFQVRDYEEFPSWKDGKVLGKLFRQVMAPSVAAHGPSLAFVETHVLNALNAARMLSVIDAPAQLRSQFFINQSEFVSKR